MQISATASSAQATTMQQAVLVKKTISVEQAQQLDLVSSVPIEAPVDVQSSNKTGRFVDKKA